MHWLSNDDAFPVLCALFKLRHGSVNSEKKFQSSQPIGLEALQGYKPEETIQSKLNIGAICIARPRSQDIVPKPRERSWKQGRPLDKGRRLAPGQRIIHRTCQTCHERIKVKGYICQYPSEPSHGRGTTHRQRKL